MTQSPLKSQQILKQTGQSVTLNNRQTNQIIMFFFNVEDMTKPTLSTRQELLFLGQSARTVSFDWYGFLKKEKAKTIHRLILPSLPTS